MEEALLNDIEDTDGFGDLIGFVRESIPPQPRDETMFVI